MWIHYLFFIMFIVLSFCGDGGKVKLLELTKRDSKVLKLFSTRTAEEEEEPKLLQTEPFTNVSFKSSGNSSNLFSTPSPLGSSSSTPTDTTTSSELPCLDKILPIEDRVAAADVIFTGRVKWIGGKVPQVELEETKGMASGPGGRIGGVTVLQFLKGANKSVEKDFLVEGFESPLLCHSTTRVREDWIFLASRISGKHVGLVSSLLKIQRKNIRQIISSLKTLHLPQKHQPQQPQQQQKTQKHQQRQQQDKPNDSEKGLHQGKNDPCSLYQCNYGAICVPSVSGPGATCQCPTDCSSYGVSLVQTSVCGSDGRNYENECELRKRSCYDQRNIALKYTGICDPCEEVDCTERQVCQLDRDRRPMCRCNDVCSRDYDPVCSSDGKTYTNECVMKVEGCKRRRPLSIIYRGECSDEVNPCDSLTCLPGEECNIDVFGIARCECPPPCESVIRPVCGSDGVTYDNRCELWRNVCVKQENISVLYAGVCGEEGPCSDFTCEFGAVCVDRQGRPVCECPDCPAQLDPVCGSDGLSYDNECFLRSEACRQRRTIDIKYRGKCSGCEDKVCSNYGVCEANERGEGSCVCPDACPEVESPVCGSDGVTYLNECLLKVTSCKKQELIVVSSRGDCDLCKHVICKYGGRCESGECICPTSCHTTREPVCASNAVTYLNECEMDKASCRMGRGALRVVFFGECAEARSSGINYELIPCNRASPLVNPHTGRDYYCGQGPDKEECPPGSYCHWSLSFAKCCPMDEAETNMTVSGPVCKGSQFGCCPDGKTESLGPNYAGCPSICQCHKLGAYEETCDPVTNQCRCKPGVGGTKCDRCEPGYWGLPQIQHGSKGCQPCACSLFGSVRDDCEQMTGQCVCKPGIGGKKCNMCPAGLVLGPKGCVLANQLQANSPHTCADLECFFGAKCHVRDGHAECLCDAQCPADSSSATPVCGSDGETYGSECHLKLYACRYQKDVVVDALGSCPPLAPLSTEPHRDHPGKSTRHLQPEYFVVNGEITSSLSNSVLHPTPVTFAVFGLLGSLCYRDKDCSVAYSHCYGSICTCKRGFAESTNRQTCVATTPGRDVSSGHSPCSKSPCKYGGTCKTLPGGSFTCLCTTESTGPLCENLVKPPYDTPSFSGSSYLEIKKIKAYNKVQMEMEFRSFTESGILMYSQQKEDGSGDFISLAIIDGFVELRYNLGSGPAIIRSHHKISPKKFHKVIAKRYQRDGLLQLDDSEGSIGQAPGHLKSLDLRGSTYIGYVKNASRRVWENVGTAEGLVGCVRSARINGRPIDLLWPGSSHVVRAEHITDCASSPCYKLPCLNQGSCRPKDDGGYKCTCVTGFSGERCEIRKSPCERKPCQGGGTCFALPSKGFICKCPPGRTGKICDKMDKTLREAVIPEFNGDSFLKFPTLESVGKSFALEVWFLPTSIDGVLLYNGQNTEGGDFIALNLKNGHVEFTFNLGSGVANLATKEKIKLKTWQVVRVRRRNRKGLLQLGKGKKVRGKSGPKLTQLNLDLPLFLGGHKNYSECHPESGVTEGFSGAIQRLVINEDILENLDEKAVGGKNVKRYRGPPCSHNPCQNGGICHPYLNRFLCKCVSGFLGKFCEQAIDEKDLQKPVLFDGTTYMQFPNTIFAVERGQHTNHFEINFRTTSGEGLMLWMSKGSSLQKDYLSLALSRGFIEFSYNLGKQKEPLRIISKIKVDDGKWHKVVVHRRKRLGVLRVDGETPIKSTSKKGAKVLNTNGKLWLGGMAKLPPGLPPSYYIGFRGCIQAVQVNNKDLNLVTQGDKNNLKFCDSNSR